MTRLPHARSAGAALASLLPGLRHRTARPVAPRGRVLIALRVGGLGLVLGGLGLGYLVLPGLEPTLSGQALEVAQRATQALLQLGH